jgi:transposase-like protein
VSDFKGRHFEGEIVLWAARWYCRYGVSYRDLEQMMGERGVSVDHSTIYRWVQRYAPEIERRLHWQWRQPRSTSWRVDETYIKVRGQWTYLYRAVDKICNTIEFYLSPTGNTAAAKRFLGKALNGLKDWEVPRVINTDKAPTYAAALAELKKEGRCPDDTVHRQVKYLNNVVEADHGKVKQLIRPVRGFKTLKTAYATIKGFEVMRALRKGQAAAFNITRDIHGETRIVERAFVLAVLIHGIAGIRWRVSHNTLIVFKDWVSRPTCSSNHVSHTRHVGQYAAGVQFPSRRAQENHCCVRRWTHYL